ncbi:hypothetical protein D3C80_1009130 [compost metagenome]
MIGQHRLHRGKFIAADLTCTDLCTAGLHVEAPTVLVLCKGDRQCPVLTADRQDSLAVTGVFKVVLLAVLLQERIHIFALHAFAGDVIVPVIAQQFGQACLVGVFRAQCFDKGFRGLFRGWKGLLCRRHARPQQAGGYNQDMREQARESLQSRMVVQRRPPL